MKPREQRLEALLERIRSAGPAGTDLVTTVRWAAGECEVAYLTARGYLDDLVHRGAVEIRYGRLKATGRDTRGRL